MKKVKTVLKDIWDDESGQGMSEYILLVVVIVALAAVFRKQITGAVTAKLSALSSSITDF